ncbi:MAG: peptidoglycan bridge formation glycyltransferase FemA/FemB family protein [Chloroflexi bacterium]|nr:peptidoglycan bridge formation glycyltransferase FemA/FemB family protein [Chloroflexota bacterium]
MPEVTFSQWRDFVAAHPDIHLLQTAEWGELKSAFGWTPARMIHGNDGVQILFRKLPLGFTIGYIPKVDSGKWGADSGIWREIDAACKNHRAIFCKLELDAWQDEVSLQPSAFRTSPHNIQPPRTITLDISGSEDDILARMKQKTRYNVRLAEKKGVTVRAWDDLDGFHQMMQVTGGRDGFGVHSLEYYRRAYELFHPTGMAEMLVAEYEGKPLAALMVFARGGRAWYVYGASNDQERNRMPTYLLQWEAMRWARLHGCTEYDLWGVPDEDEPNLEAEFESRHDGLWGVYRFKRGFGGTLKRAMQAVDRVYNPLLYWAYLKFIGNRES